MWWKKSKIFSCNQAQKLEEARAIRISSWIQDSGFGKTVEHNYLLLSIR